MMPRQFLLDVSVQCEADGCGFWEHLFVTKSLHKLTTRAASDAIRKGWIWKRETGWRCPTESEAKHKPVSRCECARGTHDAFNSDCPMNWPTESEAK